MLYWQIIANTKRSTPCAHALQFVSLLKRRHFCIILTFLYSSQINHIMCLVLSLCFLSRALILRTLFSPSWTLTWSQRGPNTSLPTYRATSPLWGSFFWAFSDTMPRSSGRHHISESSVSHSPIPWFFGLLLFLLPFLISCLLANFSHLSSPPSLLSLLYPASSSLVSCFWVRGRSRWDLWPYTALT